MRFLGRKWQKKNVGNSKGNRMRCFAPGFGGAVASTQLVSNPKDNRNGKNNRAVVAWEELRWRSGFLHCAAHIKREQLRSK
jgi:hypothetical protein